MRICKSCKQPIYTSDSYRIIHGEVYHSWCDYPKEKESSEKKEGVR